MNHGRLIMPPTELVFKKVEALSVLDVVMRRRSTSIACRSMKNWWSTPISSRILIICWLRYKGSGLYPALHISRWVEVDSRNFIIDSRKNTDLLSKRLSKASIPFAPARKENRKEVGNIRDKYSNN